MEYSFISDINLICDYLSLTHEKLAEELGISFETISRIVNKDIVPSNELLEKFYSFVYNKGIELNRLKVEHYKKNHNVILFHGSKDQITGDISLSYSRKNVDLGVGFYAGDNYEQSLDFVCLTKTGSVYVLDADYADLKILNLDVSLKWLLYIAINRSLLEEYKDTKMYQSLVGEMNLYDVIIAPIADNRMFDTIDDFVSSAISSEQAIHALKELSLGKQIVFKTTKAIKHIKMLERLYLSKAEKDNATKHKLQKIEEATKYISNAYASHIREGKYINEVFSDEIDE